MTRTQLLQELVTLSRKPSAILAELAAFGWDSSVELVVLRTDHLRSVLERYVGGVLPREAVEEWANAVEVRDDLACDSRLSAIVDELANPILYRPLSPDRAMELLSTLSTG